MRRPLAVPCGPWPSAGRAARARRQAGAPPPPAWNGLGIRRNRNGPWLTTRGCHGLATEPISLLSATPHLGNAPGFALPALPLRGLHDKPRPCGTRSREHHMGASAEEGRPAGSAAARGPAPGSCRRAWGGERVGCPLRPHPSARMAQQSQRRLDWRWAGGAHRPALERKRGHRRCIKKGRGSRSAPPAPSHARRPLHRHRRRCARAARPNANLWELWPASRAPRRG